MSKVEEVARAIFDALDPTRGDAISVTLHHSEFVDAETVEEQMEQVMSICRSAARAAIAAMEKPTWGMLATVITEPVHLYEGRSPEYVARMKAATTADRMTLAQKWSDMILAALSEDPR